MRDPGLDFQPRRPAFLSLLLLLSGLILCADVWVEEGRLRKQFEEAEARLSLTQRRAERIDAGRRDSRPENVFSAEESKVLRSTLTLIRTDWEKLFRCIDEATSEEIAVLAIRPNTAGKTVQISGEARDMAAALGFVETLRRQPLANVVLLSHQFKQADPQHPIIFEIAAIWLTDS